MILEYANNGNLSDWANKNSKDLDWSRRLNKLIYIVSGLKEIHRNRMVHRDFHTGNLLFKTHKGISLDVRISDMGLCGEVGNADGNNIYGVIPYMAPEVLRGEPYTQAADIYSFGMIMYFMATRRQPFSNCAHDHLLVLDICNGIRPKINEFEAPECYIDLMNKCWDPDPKNRPDVLKINGLIKLFHRSYLIKASNIESKQIKKQFEEVEKHRKEKRRGLSSNENDQSVIHPQANYTSRLITYSIISEGLSMAI
jgi:serine/threonine protein kinase